MKKVSDITPGIPGDDDAPPAPCGMCGTVARLGRDSRMCESCYDKFEPLFPSLVRDGDHAGIRARIAKTAPDAWMPELYRATTLDRLPSDRAVVARALAWVPTLGKPIALLHGEPGRGKSRLFALMIQKAMSGRKGAPVVYWPSELGAAIQDAWDDQSVLELETAAKRAPVFAVDDVDKTKYTPRAAEFLFGVIDARVRAGSKFPTFITTNLVGDHIAELMPSNFGKPLVRRLRENAEHFKP